MVCNEESDYIKKKVLHVENNHRQSLQMRKVEKAIKAFFFLENKIKEKIIPVRLVNIRYKIW